MTDIRIPPAALEAGARAMCHNAYKHLPEMRDQDTYTPDADYWLDQARAAFVAMVEAWPGMHTHEWQRPWLGGMSGSDLILPLPNETADQRPRRTLNELRGVFAEAYKSNREPR